ncbi:GDP-fucose protein O-fucosyltransferase 1-like [Stylophora pistillata]|uniref:GDP-fucose protein O-fucosyltransferase 1 n=1 Tax=Stylophora pistillata TaxID=50429 RepID=A0A2B4SAJ8_STYPI|nr:GDP-fucose protein O-fucosyltransferase 1-like [Stylophora pistillata]PFX25598.1 GDP-fucose protein O-fucosyltransferase 1 [Stylophora pistillata]
MHPDRANVPLYICCFILLLNQVLPSEMENSGASFSWDPRGYVFYCPCMGRFGNQAEHFLGALAFAKALDRTLILPPWRTYKNVPFSDFFQVQPLQTYHRVILAEDFMKHLAPTHWPKGIRRGYCWLPPGSDRKCIMKEGNPFKPFWDELEVDFDEKIVYHLGIHIQDPYERDQWQRKFPSSSHPVLAFRGAPASFPVEEQNRQAHAFLKWSQKINSEVDEYISNTLPKGPFVGIHLRNGIDWRNACDHAEGMPQYMASPQCLGYSRYRTVTKELCFPPKQDILNRTETAVRRFGAKAVFVATDNDPMKEELKFRLQGLNVQIFHINPWLPQIDLAILGRADFFIGNCVSSFSSFVKRERDSNGKPSTFWAFDE